MNTSAKAEKWAASSVGTAPATPARQPFAGLRGGRGADPTTHMFYTYVLRSEKDQQLYVGFTGDLKKRFQEHNAGLVEATKDRRPFQLVYYEACLKKQKAIDRESYFKTGLVRKIFN